MALLLHILACASLDRDGCIQGETQGYTDGFAAGINRCESDPQPNTTAQAAYSGSAAWTISYEACYMDSYDEGYNDGSQGDPGNEPVCDD